MSEAIAATGVEDRAPHPDAPSSDIDPFSLEFFADPFPAHQALREAGPAVWLRRYGVCAPILTMSFHACAFLAIESRSAATAGTRRSFTLTAAAMHIAEGKESFDDCAMLT